MFRILKNFGCACGCGVMLYFWLVWMFKPEGPLHHAYVVTTIEENQQKLTEGWRSLQEINPLRDALKFEPDEGVFDIEDREDVGDTSAEDNQAEPTPEGREPQQDESGQTTFGTRSAESDIEQSGDRNTGEPAVRRVTDL